MEQKITRWSNLVFGGVMGIIFLKTIFREQLSFIPTIPLLYALVTVESVLLGVIFLQSKGAVRKWKEKGVPEAVRVKFTRLQAVLYFCNAALCPVGLFVWYFLRFDQDFILIAQMIGSVAIAFLGFIPLKQKK